MNKEEIIEIGKELIKEYQEKADGDKEPTSSQIAYHWMAMGVDQFLQKIEEQ